MLVLEIGNDIVSLIRYFFGVVSLLDVIYVDLCERVNIDWKVIYRFILLLSLNIWVGYIFVWSIVFFKLLGEVKNVCIIGMWLLNYLSWIDIFNKVWILSIWWWKIEWKWNFKLKIEFDIFMKL